MAFKHFWVQYKLKKSADQAYIKATKFVIGRAPDCDLPIPTDVISRKHIRVYLEDDGIYVMDLGSTNGTFINGEQMQPDQKYKYETGDKLYIDAGKEVTFRITAIYQKDIVDPEMENKMAALEKRRSEMQSRVRSNPMSSTGIHSNENFLSGASESVDNVFENLLFIAKSARFNKEKKIREAEYQSQEILDKAKRKIEQSRALLEQEILSLQKETKKEAQRVLDLATKKAENVIHRAEEKYQRLSKEADELLEATQEKAHKERMEIVEKAQEKHGQIVADAHLRNKQLQEENKNIESDIEVYLAKKQELELEIDSLRKLYVDHEKQTEEAKDKFRDESARLEELQNTLKELEDKNEKALKVLEEEIPQKEKFLEEVNKLSQEKKAEIEKETSEINRLQENIDLKKAELEKNEHKCETMEERLDGLNQKVIEAEDNLIKLNKVKQQRNEDLDKEIAERKERQQKEEKEFEAQLAEKKQKAEDQIAKSLEEARTQAQDIIDRSLEKADETKADAREKADDIKEQAQQVADDIIKKANTEIAHIDAELKKRREDVELEIEKQKAQATLFCTEQKNQAAKAQKDADAYCERIKAEGDKYNKDQHQVADEYSQKVRGEANKYKDNTHKVADEYAAKVKGDAKAYHDEQHKKADEYATRVKQQADLDVQAKHKDFEIDIQQQKDNILAKARKEASDIVTQAQKQAEDIASKAQGFAASEKENLAAEIEKRKKQTDQEILELRSHAVKQLEEQKKQFEEDEAERNRVRVLRLRKELNDVLKARITPFLKDPEKINKVGEFVGKTINAILLDEIDDGLIDENYSDFDPSKLQKRAKNFYAYSGIALAVIFAIFYFSSNIKEAAKESSRKVAAQAEEETKQMIEQAQKQNDLSAAFHPEKTEEYRDNYTDRVLHTENYVEVELNKDYREKWILELQDFFVHELRLHEDDLVPFIAQEANLIRELKEAMDKINGNFKDEGIGRMREIEDVFINKLRQNIRDTAKFNKVMRFKQAFFEKNKTTYIRLPADTE